MEVSCLEGGAELNFSKILDDDYGVTDPQKSSEKHDPAQDEEAAAGTDTDLTCSENVSAVSQGVK